MTATNLKGFEDRLLHELHAVQAADRAAARPRLRRPRLLAASGLAALAAAGATIGPLLLTAGPAAAYGVQIGHNGIVRVQVYRPLTSRNLASLRRDLTRAGANQTVTCNSSGHLQLVPVAPTGHPVVITGPTPTGGRDLSQVESALHQARATLARCVTSSLSGADTP